MTNKTQKRNVAEFNSDVTAHGGYQYTGEAQYSAIVANKRITDATISSMPDNTSTIVDLGCGDGTYTGELAKHFPDVNILGLDPAGKAITRAKQKYPEIDFTIADLLVQETLPKTEFDVGILRGVIHHLPNGPEGIINAAKISKTLIVIEPNGNNPVLKWIESHSQYHINHEEQSFSSRELTAWCRDAGYTRIRIDYIGFIPYFFPETLSKIILFFQPLLERIYPLKKYFAGQIVLLCDNRQDVESEAS